MAKQMQTEESRTALLLGENLQKLHRARVAVFGVGGVGGAVCEALARAGIGALDIIDNDIVSLSNINRQIIALHSTVGQPKIEVMKARILDINPACTVTAHNLFYLPENADTFDLSVYDFVVDAIDTVSAKIELAVRAAALKIPLIAAMGSGNKIGPLPFLITDISKTSVCPLAKVMRVELRKRGIYHLQVCYSQESPLPTKEEYRQESPDIRRRSPGSISYMPPLAGFTIAGEVIRKLLEK